MSRWLPAWMVMLAGLAACGDDAATGTASDAADSAFDSMLSSDADVADGAVADDTADATVADTQVGDGNDAIADVADSVAPDADDTVDTSVVDTAVPDTTVASDADAIPSVVTCPVPSLVDQYPPPLPPFPYGDWPLAEGCIAQPHDVVIVLGCPSEDDGSPSDCQTKRAEIADQLFESGWSEHFIVTGGAVHNQWQEAAALHALLVGRGIPDESIVDEPLAQHTDENLYYSSRIMQDRGWLSGIVVSEDPGHLMFTGLCDADCCVKLGRMTLLSWPVAGATVVKAGHYALTPPGQDTTADECANIAGMFMCVNQDQRKACKDDFKLDDPP